MVAGWQALVLHDFAEFQEVIDAHLFEELNMLDFFLDQAKLGGAAVLAREIQGVYN